MTLSTLKTLHAAFLEYFSNYERIHEQKSCFDLVEETTLTAFSSHLIRGKKKHRRFDTISRGRINDW